MKCCVCKRKIASGVEAQKMIVNYEQADGTSKIFGFMMADGPIDKATGKITKAWHHKCYHAARKRAARGDAVTGRVLSGGPTAYELAALGFNPPDVGIVPLREYSARLEQLQSVAQEVGKAVGDLTVLEAYWARQNGGAYAHKHDYPLEPYQLLAHLQYAHGYPRSRIEDMTSLHTLLHQQMQVEPRARFTQEDNT